MAKDIVQVIEAALTQFVEMARQGGLPDIEAGGRVEGTREMAMLAR